MNSPFLKLENLIFCSITKELVLATVTFPEYYSSPQEFQEKIRRWCPCCYKELGKDFHENPNKMFHLNYTEILNFLKRDNKNE